MLKKGGHDNAAGKLDVGHFIGAKSIRVQHFELCATFSGYEHASTWGLEQRLS